MRFEAVAFDLDGTLYPATRLYLMALPAMLSRASSLIAFNEARRTIRALGTAKGLAAEDGKAFRTLEAEITAARLGMKGPQAVLEAAAMIDRDFYHDIEERFPRLKTYRGVPEALDALAKGGLRLALLSDLPPVRKIEFLGLKDRFEVALCSEDSGALKPARAPFEMLATRLGLAPQQILYVGNSRRYDIEGAKAAGMSAALVSRRPYPKA